MANLDENLDSLKVKLQPSELQEVAAAVPKEDVVGGRYSDSYVLNILWKDAITPPLNSWTPKAAQ